MSSMLYVGIDYSGAGTPDSRQAGLRVFACDGGEPEEVHLPDSPVGRRCNWTRSHLATWLMELKASGTRFIAGLDHAFSFPLDYFQLYGIADWDAFLEDFRHHWPTDNADQTVEGLLPGNPRTGDPTWLRLTERWTPSAKSVFGFNVRQGAVAKSTHAGLPWIHHLRGAPGAPIHFWPFDGWNVGETSVVAEAYPSLVRRRYPRQGRSSDQQDAYATARWLKESHERGILNRYLHPPLTQEEQTIARLEGWILGIC